MPPNGKIYYFNAVRRHNKRLRVFTCFRSQIAFPGEQKYVRPVSTLCLTWWSKRETIWKSKKCINTRREAFAVADCSSAAVQRPFGLPKTIIPSRVKRDGWFRNFVRNHALSLRCSFICRDNVDKFVFFLSHYLPLCSKFHCGRRSIFIFCMGEFYCFEPHADNGLRGQRTIKYTRLRI